MSDIDQFKIPEEKLKRVCDCEKELDFCKSSKDAAILDGLIGQDRAVQAMQFGLSMKAQGYNIYVSGLPGTGKTTYVNNSVIQVAAKGRVPDDWCYLNNFSDKDSPISISLPAGQGLVFQKDMDELIADLRSAIPKAFESSEFDKQKGKLIQELQKTMQEKFEVLQQDAARASFLVTPAPGKFVILPVKDKKPLSNEEFDNLPEEERKRIEDIGNVFQKRLEETMYEGRTLEKETAKKVVELEKSITLAAAEPSFQRLKMKYKAFPRIIEHLNAVQKDIEENRELFIQETTDVETKKVMMLTGSDREESFIRYKVNLLVNNEKTVGAPVVTESSPNYYNLFGKIEYKSQLMSVSTDFTMVKAGAIHRANGGYLILQAKDVLVEPLVWNQLKRALKYRETIVENIGEQYRYIPTTTIRMEPIPLDVKVILIGSPLFYYYLTMDEDFSKIFKVKVEFDVEMPRNQRNICEYVSFVSSICHQENMKHLNKSALGRIIEYGSRLAGDQNKLSTRFNEVAEIVYESISLAQADQADFADASHVERAIREKRYRLNRVEEKIQEMILHDKILINTKDAVVGQVNGLSVIDLGNYSFGRPSRITAVTFMGRGGVVNIERETEMSGQIHSKGVLTLAGYLGTKFAKDKPLSLTAQITFEQNYEGIEGDSASSTELYAILSSLADVPLKQYLAVTGSVNQYGEIQPIGGVTEKIEGFFDICAAKGLTGNQGVMIPASNIDNLMLKEEVLEAVRQNQFHLYAVKTIEEGIEILSGLPAGTADEKGQYQDGTVFRKVGDKLATYYKLMAKETEEEKEKEHKG